MRAASSDGSDQDSSDSSSTTTVDSGWPGGNTRPSAYSSDGGLTTEPGPATTEARRVDTSVLRWIHLMQDGEELNGSLSDKESLPCRPGRDRQSLSLEADDPVIETGLDRRPNAESMIAGSEELSSSSDELCKEFLSVLGILQGILVSQQLL